MSDDERAKEIESVKAKLAASEGRDGLAKRVVALKARLAELEGGE
jgi:hypothetical protein